MDKQRDEEGRFKKGWVGGPGRGKRSEDIELDSEILADVKKVIRKGMANKDIALRLKAAGLGVRLESVRKSDTKEKSILSPEAQFFYDFLVAIHLRFERKDGEPFTKIDDGGFTAGDAMNEIIEHMRDCPDSPYHVNDDLLEYDASDDDAP